VKLQHGFCLRKGIDQHPAQHRADGMELVLEGGHDTKVPAAAPHAPEQVGVLGGAGGEALAVRRDEIDGAEVIGGHAGPDGEAVMHCAGARTPRSLTVTPSA
jgi:hypothetical protein